jgi:hypothetical protein
MHLIQARAAVGAYQLAFEVLKPAQNTLDHRRIPLPS